MSQSKDPNCMNMSAHAGDTVDSDSDGAEGGNEEQHQTFSDDGGEFPPKQDGSQTDHLDTDMDVDGNLAAPSDHYWEQFHDQYLPEEGGEGSGDQSDPSGDQMDTVDLEDGGDNEEPGKDCRVKPSLPRTRTEWHPNGGKTFGKRKDIFEKIQTDPTEDGRSRKSNIYHPFRDEMDYKMGRFFSTLDIPMGKLDEFLQLDFVRSFPS